MGKIAKELFKFNVNLLKGMSAEKFEKINNLIERMKSIEMNRRPICNEILQEKALWAIELSDIKEDNEFKSIISQSDNVSIKDNFISYYIKYKNNFCNNKIVKDDRTYHFQTEDENEVEVLIRCKEAALEKEFDNNCIQSASMEDQN